MKERLVIKNFGPIKSVDIELGKMTILIGEQATGKSTIAKVLSVCRYFSYITDIELNLNVYSNSFLDGLQAWGLQGFVNNDSYIKYISEDYTLIVEHIIQNLPVAEDEEGKHLFEDLRIFTPTIIDKSEKFQQLLDDLQGLKPKETISVDYMFFQIPTHYFQNNIMKVMNNPFYFPTERGLQSIFSLGKTSIQNLSDSLFNQFARLDQIVKNYNTETHINPLNIYYKNENGQGLVKKSNDEKYFTLNTGASGYQSTVPIVLAIKYYNEIQKRARTFIVEEPELNLFPKAQKKVIEFFAETISRYKNSFLLPTHSPYILSSLNNLMYAHYIGHINKGEYKERVNRIVDNRLWINPDDVHAYFIDVTGRSVDIVNRESHLINTDFIDGVSREISQEFDELLNIEIEFQDERD